MAIRNMVKKSDGTKMHFMPSDFLQDPSQDYVNAFLTVNTLYHKWDYRVAFLP